MKDEDLYLKIKEGARNQAAAQIFNIMNSDEKTEKFINAYKKMSDQQIEIMARFLKIPNQHYETYRALVRGEDNNFTKCLSEFNEKNMLRAGDVILMCGTSRPSKILLELQKRTYSEARSSHVALVYSEFVAVDAMPEIGVSMRLITEVLTNAEKNWRIIRFKNLNNSHYEKFLQGGAFYLAQPYSIRPKKGNGKNFSYCSELVRKIYRGLEINNTGIPNNLIIKPCDFDKLADKSSSWEDITESVKDYIDFCEDFESIIRSISKLQIDGLKLNQSRYEERRKYLQIAHQAYKKGAITQEKLGEVKRTVRQIEDQLNFKFWRYM